MAEKYDAAYHGMVTAQPKPTAAERAVSIVEAHQRTSQGLCSADHPRDQFIDSGVPMWTPDHVVRLLAAAGLLATAEHDREIAAQALRDAAGSWQAGGWASDLPKSSSRHAVILGMAENATAWLRARADRIAAGEVP